MFLQILSVSLTFAFLFLFVELGCCENSLRIPSVSFRHPLCMSVLELKVGIEGCVSNVSILL